MSFDLFVFFPFIIKPEGIEKEETFNTLLCASGKCKTEINSDVKLLGRV